MNRSRERREFIAMRLGMKLLDAKELTREDVKTAVEQAREWMAQEQLRDEAAKVLEGGNLRERLKELLE